MLTRVLVASLALLVTESAVGAQISVNSDDGDTVTIGGDGIRIKSGSTSGQGQIHIGPTSSHIVSGASALSLSTKVARIEEATYGKVATQKPLIARITQLEIDNLGEKRTGTPNQRVAYLATQLGISFEPQTIINVTSTPQASVSKIVEKTDGRMITLHENNAAQTLHCDGNGVALYSNNCAVNITGHCKVLSVYGNNNAVTVEHVGVLVTAGNNNVVHWTQDPTPEISNMGSSNLLSKSTM